MTARSASPLPLRFLRALGLHVRPLDAGAWLVRRRSGAPLAVRRLDRQTWLVQRPGPKRRRVVRIGKARLRADLVVAPEALGGSRGKLHKQLGKYLGSEHLVWVLEHLRVNCVLDVGANTGQFATRLREAGYRGRIVSFEPLAEFAGPLRENAADDPDWVTFDCALGDRDGTAEIHATPGKISSLLPPSDFGRAWSTKLLETRTETIRIRRLDAVLDEATAGLDDPRVFLKMDTQGYDLATFRGAGDRISEILGLQSEIAFMPIYEGMPRFTEQLTVYEAAGFEVTGFFPVSSEERTLRAIESDVVMVRADAG